LLGLKPSTSRYLCQKCYNELNIIVNGLNSLKYYTKNYCLRYKEYFLDIQKYPNNSIYIYDINDKLLSNTPGWYRFNTLLKYDLFKLESFNPMLDT
jgi:hypothetical protein